MDICTLCGSPEVVTHYERTPRCERHATESVPREFHGVSPHAALEQVPVEAWHRVSVEELSVGSSASEGDARPMVLAQGVPFRTSKELLRLLGVPSDVFHLFDDDGRVQEELLRRLARTRDMDAIHARVCDGEVVGIREYSETAPLTLRQALQVAFEEIDRGGWLHDSVVEDVSYGPPSRCHLLTQVSKSMSKNEGDLIAAGVVLSLNGTTKAQPFLRRLWCANGMTRDETPGIDVADRFDFRSQVRASLHFGVGEFIESFTRSDDVIVAAPERSLNRVSLPRELGSLRAEIRRRLGRFEGRVATAFDVVNTVTGIHHNAPTLASELAVAGGRISSALSHRKSTCVTCGGRI